MAITPQLRVALERVYALRTTDSVIEYGGRAVGSIKTAFRATAERAGFPSWIVTPYVLRHTAATWMVQQGVSLWDIAGRLGHRDTRMVERHYAHHHPSYQRATTALDAALAAVGEPDSAALR